jgi:transposase
VLPVSNARLSGVLSGGCSDQFKQKGCFIMSEFLSDFVVGIDVSSEFSVVAMLEPNGSLIRKPFRIDHNPAGFNKLLIILRKEEERLKQKPIYFVESTGIFHLPLFFFLKSNDLKGFVLNPLCVHSTKNFNLRKVKNDEKDAESIARLAKFQNVKYSLVPEPQILALRMLLREYYSISDMLTELKNRLCTDLYLLFPGYLDVFSDPFGKSSLKILRDYPTPQAILSESPDTLAKMMASTSRKGLIWGQKKVAKLVEMAQLCLSMPMEFSILSRKIQFHLDGIEMFQNNQVGLKEQLVGMVSDVDFPKTVRESIALLEAMPGIGFMTAATILAEIGDFSRFHSPKALVAFFGIDPSVNQSGKFNGDRNKISKRGTRLGRRVLFTAALSSIRTTSKGDPINPILRDYYQNKCLNKKKKVALVAVMHKLLHYIFAVLRDQKPFEFRSPEDHQSWRNSNRSSLTLVA